MLPVLRDTQIYREVATLILLIYLKIERNRILATGTGVALFVLEIPENRLPLSAVQGSPSGLRPPVNP